MILWVFDVDFTATSLLDVAVPKDFVATFLFDVTILVEVPRFYAIEIKVEVFVPVAVIISVGCLDLLYIYICEWGT